jgi:hypothetical protein
MNIIWGYKADPHITAQQLRNTYVGIFGGDTHILDTGSKLAATVVSATEVQIADGVMIAQGCTASIEYGMTESLTIANGSQGMLRKDLIVARYTKAAGTGIENMSLAVITGTPASASPAVPSHNTGVIVDGDSPIDFPLYVVNLSGISITSVDALVDTIGIKGMIEALEQSVSDTLTDYMLRKAFHTGGHSADANGTISYTFTILDADIPTGYKPFNVRVSTNGGGSSWYDFYNCECDFVENTDNKVVSLKFQKRTGAGGGTLYPWIVVEFVKDLS